jgi:hypothetical protein|tara:strand:+ start:603 stop:1043 length:441 start_codon:yes stop_codon:yes gene_type:complete
MPYVRTFNIFVSHAWSANEEYIRLVGLLKRIKRFNIEIISLPEYEPAIDLDSSSGMQKLKGIMEIQVRSSNCALILPRMYISSEFWIKYAMHLCQMYGVSPLAMAPAEGEGLPAVLSIKADAVIDWNIEALEEGIKEFSTTRFGAT